MKTHLDIKHEGTLGAEGRVKMSFDENSVTHLMSVLTDLYSDPALAVIREYSTNAYDSHRAAGNPAPIKVWLPTGMNPVFVVKDEGIGMTVDDVCNHFSKYGWSSKRDTDNEVGMLGLGCKSGLTYTSQFTFVAIQNGVKATVLVTRDDDGTGAIQIVDTVSTDAPNGVEVRVPVKDVSSFCYKAEEFFSFWEQGSVLVNDVEPTSVFSNPDALVLDKDIVLLSQTVKHKDYIVMGNVPYPVASATPLNKTYQHCAVARVPIGAVNFTPSREALHYTKRTTQTISEIAAKIDKLIVEKANEAMDDCKSHREAIFCAHQWRTVVPNRSALRYKGKEIPYTVQIEVLEGTLGDSPPVRKAFVWPSRAATDEMASNCLTVQCVDAFEVLFVIGHRGNGVTQLTKKRIKKYVADKGLDWPRVFFVPGEMPGGEWLEEANRIHYDDLRKIVIEGENRPKRNKEIVKVVGPTGYINERERSKLTTPLTYIQSSHWLNEYMSAIGHVVQDSGGTCVYLTARQVDKFKRDYPHAVPFTEWLELHAKGFLATLSPVEAYFLAKGETPTPALKIDPKKILDPEYRALVEQVLAADFGKRDDWSRILRVCQKLNVPRGNPGHRAFGEQQEAMFKRYPLIRALQHSYSRFVNSGEYLDYINGVYLLRQNQSTNP